MENIIYSSKRTKCDVCNSSDGKAQILKYFDFDLSGNDYFKCFACGELRTPKGETKRKIQAPAVQHRAAKAPALNQWQRTELLKNLYKESTENRTRNNFASHIIDLLSYEFDGIYSYELADRFLQYFGIGSDRNGNTIFWHRNYSGILTHSKAVSYSTNGKRLKKTDSKLVLVDKSGKRSYCDALNGYATNVSDLPKFEFTSKSKGYDTEHFFGEHFINPEYLHTDLINFKGIKRDITTPIICVESEKTMALCNLLCFDSGIFIATGGSENITPAKVSVLENRNVYICFDNDASGSKGAAKLQRLLPNAKIIEPQLLGIDFAKGDLYDVLQNSKQLYLAKKIFYHSGSFNYNINLDFDYCDCTAPANELKRFA